MKKLLAIAVTVSMLSGLYGLTLGIGGACQDVAKDGRYFVIKGDARVPVLPIVELRADILGLSLQEEAKMVSFSTGMGTDLLIKIPMPAAFQPYLVFGLGFNYGLEDTLDMVLTLKAGIGGEMYFGALSAYLESGVNPFSYTKVGEADALTTNPLYVQLGILLPVAR